MSEEADIPENIKNKILELKKLETVLGHLPSESWTVNELQKKTEDNHQHSVVQIEAQTEILFSEICDDLKQHQYSYAQIAAAVNKLFCQNVGIKYCNESEVKDALGIK